MGNVRVVVLDIVCSLGDSIILHSGNDDLELYFFCIMSKDILIKTSIIVLSSNSINTFILEKS